MYSYVLHVLNTDVGFCDFRREFYEPYVICARSSIPLFDERFT